jgi:glutathione S-transferase
MSELEAPLWTMAKHGNLLPQTYRIDLPATRRTAQYEFSRALAALEKELPVNSFVLGHHFTLADIFIGQTLFWAGRAQFPIEGERVQAYLAKIKDRPSLKSLNAKKDQLANGQGTISF